jgi:DNA processing protein
VVEALADARRSDLAEPPRPVSGSLTTGTPAPSAAQRDALLSLLGSSPLGVDELVRQCHLTAAEVMILVLELELAGRVRRDSSGTVSLK